MKFAALAVGIGMMTIVYSDSSPISSKTAEGKSVYTPISQPINLQQEIRIQQEDQNKTRGISR